MADARYQFVAESLGSGAVSGDGYEITIEFEGGGELIWITMPTDLLEPLTDLAARLRPMATAAKNGTATVWHARLSLPQRG